MEASNVTSSPPMYLPVKCYTGVKESYDSNTNQELQGIIPVVIYPNRKCNCYVTVIKLRVFGKCIISIVLEWEHSNKTQTGVLVINYFTVFYLYS